VPSALWSGTPCQGGIDWPRKGAHQFRHTLASDLLRQGRSLSEIGEILRHRSPQTTAIYAKLDLRSLRGLALPGLEVDDEGAQEGVRDYIKMRRSWDTSCKKPKLLHDFTSFLQQQGASQITIPLAVQWAQRNPKVQPAEWARRLTCVRALLATGSPRTPNRDPGLGLDAASVPSRTTLSVHGGGD